MGPRDLNNEVPRASSNDAHLRSIIQCAGVCVCVGERGAAADSCGSCAREKKTMGERSGYRVI